MEPIFEPEFRQALRSVGLRFEGENIKQDEWICEEFGSKGRAG